MLPSGLRPAGSSYRASASSVAWAGKIAHVVIVFQENRSVDNLFNGLPGADTQTWGLNHLGQQVPLRPISLRAHYDISHTHGAFNTEYDGGRLDGFDLVRKDAYGIVPRREAQPYFDMAQQYAFGDRMFQTNQGPSFPAHQYIISGTSTISNGSTIRAAENPSDSEHKSTGGCNSPPGSKVRLIDRSGNEFRSVYPCFERLTLMDEIAGQQLTWRYYQESYAPGLWGAPAAIEHLARSGHYSREVHVPSPSVLSDIASGNLASVVWVTPDRAASDHTGVNDGSGPSWVTSIVNAVGQSQYWNNTVIFVTWDDWGGWYDHVKPPFYNSYELGFRVPLLVIAPYAKQGYVSHVQHEFGSILKFVEETYGLPSMGTTDARADDLADCFDFTQAPRAFTPIQAPLAAAHFINAPPSSGAVDDDN
jgi:phospholipase C